MIDTENFESSRKTRFVTIVGLVCNLLLTGLKFVAGVYGHSQALVADAIHSLSDTISDLAVIVGSYYWNKPADHDHPYGHRRIETLVTIFVGLMLLAAGVGIIRQAFISIREESAHDVNAIALVAALLSIVLKEWMYRWTRKVGEKIGSPALIANAWHHRSDAFSSIPALIAVAVTLLVPEWYFLDRFGAILVSLFIMHAAYQILQPGLLELVDGSAPPEICGEILALTERVAGVQQVHELRTRYSSNSLHVDMHVVVDGTISVQQGHDIAGAVKWKILKAGLGAVDVVVHVEPLAENSL